MNFRNAAPVIALAMIAVLNAQEAPPPSLDDLLKSARASYAKGDYKAARASLEQAGTLADQTPPEEPKRYDVLKQMYAVLSAAGQYEDASNYLQQAISWRENTLGKEHPKVAEDLTELAMLCRNLKDIPRGLNILGIVNSMYFRSGGMENPLVADNFSRMALLYMDDQQPERAVGALRTAIGIREKLLGPDHAGLLTELSRLGSILIVLRDYEKAEDVYHRTLVIHERAVGPGSADLIPTVEGLAYACFGQKKYADAEPYYLRLLALWQKIGGKDYPMVAMTFDKLSVFYREQDRREEADAAMVNANAIRSLFYATGLSEEASARLVHKEKEEATRLYLLAATALDPSRAEHQELLSQIEKNLKELNATVQKPAPPTSQKKTNPKGFRKALAP